jgi:hypothetical protein
MSTTYRTSPDEWAPGYMATYIHDDGRYAVVINGRPVFSGTGYVPGPFHDQRMQVADILCFAYARVGDGRLAGGTGYGWPDDVDTVGHELENVA